MKKKKTKFNKSLKYILIILLFIIFSYLCGSFIKLIDTTIKNRNYKATPNSPVIETIDLNTFDPTKQVAPNHAHVWETKYNDSKHWEQCKICSQKRGEANHSLHGNGGPRDECDIYYNRNYRELCNCGYVGKPYVVLHGRYNNWKNSKTLNYGYLNGTKLDNIKQIPRAEFNSRNYPARADGHQYTWEDPDGDGYGWVFCGGVVLSDSRGTIGTIESVLGKANVANTGRKQEFDEAYELSEYMASDSTPTLQEFINRLPAKNTIQTDHLLYGLKEKYQRITRCTMEQFGKRI